MVQDAPELVELCCCAGGTKCSAICDRLDKHHPSVNARDEAFKPTCPAACTGGTCLESRQCQQVPAGQQLRLQLRQVPEQSAAAELPVEPGLPSDTELACPTAGTTMHTVSSCLPAAAMFVHHLQHHAGLKKDGAFACHEEEPSRLTQKA